MIKQLKKLQKARFSKADIPALLLPVIAVVIFLVTPMYNKASKEYIDNSLQEAIITYAIVRGINAGVSVFQESSLTVGVGISGNIALGQVLDPINDATERFSTLITLSLWTLGAEKILFEITQIGASFYIVLITSALFLFYRHPLLQKLLIILIVLRLFIPISAVVVTYLDQSLFAPKIEAQKAILETTKFQSVHNIVKEKDQGFLSKIRGNLNEVNEFKQKLNYYIRNSEKIISALVQLSILFFSKFFLEIIFLPLLIYYIIRNSVRMN